MAERTGGTFYPVNTQQALATLPQIFIKEAQTVKLPAALKSSRMERVSWGSPSEMTMTCFCPASVAFRSRRVMLSEGSKLGMSPNWSRLMARLAPEVSPTVEMG